MKKQNNNGIIPKKTNLLQKLIKKTKKKKQTKTKDLTQHQKQKAPFKIVLSISFASYGNKVIELFNQKGIKLSNMIRGYGTAESSMLSLLGIKETERDIAIGIVESENTENFIPQMLEEFDKNNLKGTFCALLSPSSASLEMLNFIKLLGEKND